jgi:hypothetical protein
MKKLLLLLLFIPLASFSQEWDFSIGKNDFDGEYRTASVTGKGTDFPYNKPILVVNKYENENDFNFYVSNAGVFQSDLSTRAKWVFDNEPETIYSTYDLSISNDGKVIFFNIFNDPKIEGKLGNTTKIELIEKLLYSNKVSLRVESKFDSNDIIFSLKGSTRAINSVLGKENIKLLLEKPKQEKLKLKMEKEKELSLMKSNEAVLKKLLSTADSEMLTSKSIENLKLQLEKDLGLGTRISLATNLNYKTIKLKRVPGKSDRIFKDFGNVEIYYILDDESEIKINGTWRVKKGAPIYKRLLID